MFHLFNSRSIRRSAFCCDFFSNKAVFVVGALMVVLQLAITYLPFMNRVFGTQPMALRDWVLPALLGFTVLIVVELEKGFMRWLDARREENKGNFAPRRRLNRPVGKDNRDGVYESL